MEQNVNILCALNTPGVRGQSPRVSPPRRDPGFLERFIATDPDFVGIGRATAANLARSFGTDLHRILADGSDPRLVAVLNPDGLEKALVLHTVYTAKLVTMDLVAWLDELRVDPGVGRRIVRVWGERGAAALRENPYYLLAFGVGWVQAEKIAKAIGIKDDDPRRMVAAVETVLYSGLSDKHTLVARPAVAREVTRLLRQSALAGPAVDLAVQDGAAIPFGDGLQPAGAAEMEEVVARCVRLRSVELAQGDLVARKVRPDELSSALDGYDRRNAYPLTDRQRDAVAMALSQRIGVLAGYAGSGKTSVLRAVCEIGRTFGRAMHLMALSGRAAKRIQEATGQPSRTIAGFMLAAEEGDLTLGPEAIVVIDEASMVDLPLMYRIVRHIGEASLILVGDPAQLPPIGFGKVLGAMLGQDSVPTVVLDRVLRQDHETGIPSIAEAIRNGRSPRLAQFNGLADGVSFIDCTADEAFGRIVEVRQRLGSGGMRPGESQIIASSKRGAAGIDALNTLFQDRMTRGKPWFPGSTRLRIGDPVIWTQNDWERGFMNGSMGRLVALQGQGITLAEIDGKEEFLTATDAPLLDPAYCISVHKAQGSQWDRVILPVFPSRNLDRTLLYTAVTRAVRQVIVVGDRDAFDRAVRLPPRVDARAVTLGARLAEKGRCS